MKYVIDLPENKPIMIMDGERVEIITPDKNEMFVFKDITSSVVKLTPYDEEQIRKEVQNEVWEAVKKVFGSTLYGGYTSNVMYDIFGKDSCASIPFKFTAQEVIDKVKVYDDKQKEIHVGDEIEHPDGRTMIVTDADRLYGVKFCDWSAMDRSEFRKTGRHFETFEEMKHEHN